MGNPAAASQDFATSSPKTTLCICSVFCETWEICSEDACWLTRTLSEQKPGLVRESSACNEVQALLGKLLQRWTGYVLHIPPPPPQSPGLAASLTSSPEPCCSSMAWQSGSKDTTSFICDSNSTTKLQHACFGQTTRYRKACDWRESFQRHPHAPQLKPKPNAHRKVR